MKAPRPLKIVMLAVQHGAHDDRIFYKEASSLARRGHEVVILFSGEEQSEEVKNGVRIRSISTPLSTTQALLKKVYRGKFYSSFLEEAIAEKADLYLAHEAQSVFIALKAAKATGATPIFDSHESLNFSNKKDIYALQNHIPEIKHFLAVNSMVADDIAALRKDAEVQIVRNASVFTASEIVHKEPLTVCFEGSLGFDRGLKEMCSLFIEVLEKRNLDIRFKVIGELFGEEKAYFGAQMSQHHGLKSVEFTGWKEYEDVQAELECGSIGLIMNHRTPNNVYSSPNKLFNYIACNMCVISVDLPFITELIGRYENGIILEQLDPVLFADAIEGLANDKSTLQGLCKKSMKAHKALSWEQESERLIEFLEQVARLKVGQ